MIIKSLLHFSGNSYLCRHTLKIFCILWFLNFSVLCIILSFLSFNLKICLLPVDNFPQYFRAYIIFMICFIRSFLYFLVFYIAFDRSLLILFGSLGFEFLYPQFTSLFNLYFRLGTKFYFCWFFTAYLNFNSIFHFEVFEIVW